MHRVYYLGFKDNGGARIAVLPPFDKSWALILTTFATAAVAKYYHDDTGCYHTYVG
jgi:hypothetical protein